MSAGKLYIQSKAFLGQTISPSTAFLQNFPELALGLPRRRNCPKNCPVKRLVLCGDTDAVVVCLAASMFTTQHGKTCCVALSHAGRPVYQYDTPSLL